MAPSCSSSPPSPGATVVNWAPPWAESTTGGCSELLPSTDCAPAARGSSAGSWGRVNPEAFPFNYRQPDPTDTALSLSEGDDNQL